MPAVLYHSCDVNVDLHWIFGDKVSERIFLYLLFATSQLNVPYNITFNQYDFVPSSSLMCLKSLVCFSIDTGSVYLHC